VLLGRLHASEGDRPETIGLGDAANDLPFLQRVDHAVIVPRPSGRPDETLAAALPRAATAPSPVPAGRRRSRPAPRARRGRSYRFLSVTATSPAPTSTIVVSKPGSVEIART
jgi:hypothetical protein